MYNNYAAGKQASMLKIEHKRARKISRRQTSISYLKIMISFSNKFMITLSNFAGIKCKKNTISVEREWEWEKERKEYKINN